MFVLVVTLLVVAALLVFASGSVRYISNNRIAIVEKLWSPTGSVKRGLIALNGEAGYQPDVLRGGLHILFPFQYHLHIQPLVTIPQGRIGYIFARDGASLLAGQTLASNASVADFQDARTFLTGGGQKGPQRSVLREGAYAINLVQFVVVTKDRPYAMKLDPAETALLNEMAGIIESRGGFEPVVIKDADDQIGIVTVHDGPALANGEIIAPMVGNEAAHAETFHNTFQDPERFLAAHGRRGRQLQVLVEGTYFINRLFATVERIPKTIVEVGHVGVVVSYTGATGIDKSDRATRRVRRIPPIRRGDSLQHLRRQGADGADDQLHPEVGSERRRRPQAR